MLWQLPSPCFWLPRRLGSMPNKVAAVRIDSDDIGGVVTSANGPEAGVWVIAETTDLPTKFAKIVVTDDQGRYLMPDLPKANYNVWVRGYGLIDSPKVRATPGKTLNLKAVVAPNGSRRGRILSGDLLVLDAQDSRQERVPRHRRKRQRHAGKTADIRSSGWMSSRPTAAILVINSATRRRARFPRSSVNSKLPPTRGSGGSFPDKR